MLATLAGFLALLLGLSLLLLPLLVTELSRPRDSAWGAVVLLLPAGQGDRAPSQGAPGTRWCGIAHGRPGCFADAHRGT